MQIVLEQKKIDVMLKQKVCKSNNISNKNVKTNREES